MALIKCEECGHEISDKATFCPNCGCPRGNDVSELKQQESSLSQRRNGINKSYIIVIAVVIIIGLFLCVFFTNNLLPTETRTEAVQDSLENIEGQDKALVVPQNATTNPEEHEKDEVLDKVVGTYTFDYAQSGRFHCAPIVVLPDGRCVILYQNLGGDITSTLIGTVDMLSDKVFTLVDRKEFVLDLNTYVLRNGLEDHCGTTYQWKWNYYDYLVFDLNEMRLYQSLKEYQNRDISDAQFTKITNHTSSTSLNQ